MTKVRSSEGRGDSELQHIVAFRVEDRTGKTFKSALRATAQAAVNDNPMKMVI